MLLLAGSAGLAGLGLAPEAGGDVRVCWFPLGLDYGVCLECYGSVCPPYRCPRGPVEIRPVCRA